MDDLLEHSCVYDAQHASYKHSPLGADPKAYPQHLLDIFLGVTGPKSTGRSDLSQLMSPSSRKMIISLFELEKEFNDTISVEWYATRI